MTDKISSELQQQLEVQHSNESKRQINVLISCTEGGYDEVRKALITREVHILQDWAELGVIRVALNAADIVELSQSQFVEMIELDQEARIQ